MVRPINSDGESIVTTINGTQNNSISTQGSGLLKKNQFALLGADIADIGEGAVNALVPPKKKFQ